ncbi:chloride channel protein [Nitratifractor sp.]
MVHGLSRLDPAVREYGVSEIADMVEKGRMEITLRGLGLKILASALSLSSGYAVGNEGPSAAIGAMIAHRLHRWIRLPRQALRLALSVGAGAGISAVFVSPMTGVAFSLESIAYRYVHNYMGLLIFASALAFSVAWLFLSPMLFGYSAGRTLRYETLEAVLLFLPVLVAALYFYFSLKRGLFPLLDDWLERRWPRAKPLLFALLGALGIGTVLVWMPLAAFSGHELVALLINAQSHFALWLLLAVVALRIFTTTLSLFAGAVGGLFLPLMSIGALLGYAFAEGMGQFGYHLEPYYFAAIGASVFVGVVMQLPLTAVILAMEITYDYNVVVPAAVAIVLTGYLVRIRFRIQRLGQIAPRHEVPPADSSAQRNAP